MFFNLDRNSKQNLFNQYKQDAIDYRQRKNFEKQRRIQEEREFLAKREQLEKEADEKIYREKLERKNAQKEEYNSMLMKTKNNIPGYRHNANRHREIVLNNWGGQEKSHQIQYQPNLQSPPPQENPKNEFITIPQGDESPWKGKKLYKNEDHLGNFLNDDRNDQELNKYINSEKEYKQKVYKDLLYSQFQEATNKNLNLYGTNDPLIVERKRKRYLSQDPFAKNNNSNMQSQSNNILNPNNIRAYKEYNPLEEFKSNNYDTSNISRGIKMNKAFNPNLIMESNNNNLNNNNSLRFEENQKGQNQNNGYINNSFRPTPSGERIRQAAASNFF